MGISNVDTSSDILSKYDLDGTELYGVDGQTILDIREMVTEHIKSFLEGEEWNLKI
ncbi:hypothetical protein [Clostridium tetani]|uniref:hypothetical protein n=1 Tax=Clostridium tetani TaxID=1513 RepID=UPI0013E8FC3D|nr:hypothetical protein [Clostridium tetani]